MAEKLNAILKSYVADGTATKDKLLGAAFVVVSKDGPIYQGSAGRTSLDPASAAFTPSSIAWTASLSKLITTLTLIRLVEQNQISLDEDVRPRVPELAQLPILRGFATAATHPNKEEGEPILEPNTAPITLRHLLVHTAGLGLDIADPDLLRWSQWIGRTARADNSTVEGWSTPFMFAPGEGWYYGTGPDWAGQVLERVTGRRLSEYMNEHILRPLGTGGTGFYIYKLVGEEGKRDDRYVSMTERDGQTGQLQELPVPFPVDPPCESGGAGLYTNGADYGRVLQELLRALAGDEGAVVKEATAEEMFRPQLNDKQREWQRRIVWAFGSGAEIPEGSLVDFGIGGMLNMEDIEGKRKKGSMMWSGFCNGRWWIDPQTGIAGVMFVSLFPYSDPTAVELYDKLERAVYAELIPNWQASK
ncbi:beta-lactamase/transpeptidase-like protein [Corynascus novoguineensis]|uniref:Beta-lactamase/transpeptidase-like protein n=1 Tax=Corynascus novoguineensis TaxID=1126955 RepID=A0AAN7CL80_9PEZI|nr:beta-lactamase/transpeptidase-like protein [Corynascus novoguineensis]